MHSITRFVLASLALGVLTYFAIGIGDRVVTQHKHVTQAMKVPEIK